MTTVRLNEPWLAMSVPTTGACIRAAASSVLRSTNEYDRRFSAKSSRFGRFLQPPSVHRVRRRGAENAAKRGQWPSEFRIQEAGHGAGEPAGLGRCDSLANPPVPQPTPPSKKSTPPPPRQGALPRAWPENPTGRFDGTNHTTGIKRRSAPHGLATGDASIRTRCWSRATPTLPATTITDEPAKSPSKVRVS